VTAKAAADLLPSAHDGQSCSNDYTRRGSKHPGPWFLTLLIVVPIGRTVIRSESWDSAISQGHGAASVRAETKVP
jgi:hypothetical protein